MHMLQQPSLADQRGCSRLCLRLNPPISDLRHPVGALHMQPVVVCGPIESCSEIGRLQCTPGVSDMSSVNMHSFRSCAASSTHRHALEVRKKPQGAKRDLDRWLC